MSKTLIIAEKPSVARDIAKALGGFAKQDDWLESSGAIISSGIGHLVTLDVPQARISGKSLSTLPVIPEQFDLMAIERTKSQFQLVKRLMSRSDVSSIVNACDAGREGELIFQYIYDLAGCKKPVQRLWLQSMTADAIRDGYSKMKSSTHYQHLSDAAKCRSEADWLVGVNGTRGVTSLNKILTSIYEMRTVGRVQTPTLAILVNRENDIKNFVPEHFWELEGSFDSADGTYKSKWVDVNFKKEAAEQDQNDDDDGSATKGNRANRIWKKESAQAMLAKCKGVAPSSVTDHQSVKYEFPNQLFDLTTLQRFANKAFKFSAQKTLDIAQALYEKHKVISYPRTDARVLPEDYVQTAKNHLSAIKSVGNFAPHIDTILNNGWVKQSSKRIFDNSGISDHFAIIPTGQISHTMTADEEKIYGVIVESFVSVFFPPAEYAQTTRITLVAGETFRCSGRVLVNPGFLVVSGAKKKNGSMPLVAKDEQVKNKSMALKEMQTSAPSRLTEAQLLGAMENAGKIVDDESLKSALKERGLGTPATRAATIEKLLLDKKTNDKKEVIKIEPDVVRVGKEQHLVPTEKGMTIISFLRDNGLEILTSPAMTGDWEMRLGMMEKGKYLRTDFMREINQFTQKMIDIMRGKTNLKAIAAVPEMVLDCACPCCKMSGSLKSMGEMVLCQACNFMTPMIVASHVMTKEEMETMLGTGRSPLITTLVSRAGKNFSAMLEFNAKTKKTSFVFPERADAESIPDSVEPLKAKCPKCNGQVYLRGGSNARYSCMNNDFSMWQNMGGRIFTDDEVAELIQKGKLENLTGFISTRTNKGYDAGVQLSSDKKKVEFLFNRK